MAEHGEILTVDGATGTAANVVTGITTAYTKVTGFTLKGPGNGISVNPDNDELIPVNDSIYYAFCHLTYYPPADTEVQFALMKDDAATNIKGEEYIYGTGAFPSSLSFGGVIDLDALDRMSVGVRFGAGSGEITIKQGHFGLFRVSS